MGQNTSKEVASPELVNASRSFPPNEWAKLIETAFRIQKDSSNKKLDAIVIDRVKFVALFSVPGTSFGSNLYSFFKAEGAVLNLIRFAQGMQKCCKGRPQVALKVLYEMGAQEKPSHDGDAVVSALEIILAMNSVSFPDNSGDIDVTPFVTGFHSDPRSAIAPDDECENFRQWCDQTFDSFHIIIRQFLEGRYLNQTLSPESCLFNPGTLPEPSHILSPAHVFGLAATESRLQCSWSRLYCSLTDGMDFDRLCYSLQVRPRLRYMRGLCEVNCNYWNEGRKEGL